MSSHHDTIAISKSYHDSVETYGRHFLKIAGVALIPHVISFLLFTSMQASVVSGFARIAEVADFFSFSNINLIVSLLILFTVLVIQVLGLAALVSMIVNHERISLLSAFEHALEYFWRVLGYLVALLLVSLVALVIGFLIVTALGIVFGLFSLELLNSSFIWLDTIIPSVVTTLLANFFLFGFFSVVERNHSVGEAMRASYLMVRPRYWAVLVRVLILYALVFALAYVLQFLPQVGNLITVVVVSPFVLVYLFVLYNDLKDVKGTNA